VSSWGGGGESFGAHAASSLSGSRMSVLSLKIYTQRRRGRREKGRSAEWTKRIDEQNRTSAPFTKSTAIEIKEGKPRGAIPSTPLHCPEISTPAIDALIEWGS